MPAQRIDQVLPPAAMARLSKINASLDPERRVAARGSRARYDHPQAAEVLGFDRQDNEQDAFNASEE